MSEKPRPKSAERCPCPPTYKVCAFPGAFYFGIAGHNYDWTSPRNDALWRDGAKTLFDPCPAGWRVPRGEEEKRSPWQAFCSAEHEIIGGAWDAAAGGAWWEASVAYGGRVWYAASGLRNNQPGELGDHGTRGLIWVSSSLTATASYFNVSPKSTFLNSAVRAYGFPVRCVRE